MKKTYLIFFFCLFLFVFFIPFPAYASAAVSPSIPVGTVPYFDLPQGAQRSFEDMFYEACRYLFSGREKKQIVYTDKNGKEHIMTESSLKADWENFKSDLSISVTPKSDVVYDPSLQNYNFVPSVGAVGERYSCYRVIYPIVESVCEDLSNQTEAELLNPVKTTVFRDAFDRSNNVFHKLDDELDLIDDGVIPLSKISSQYGITNIESCDYRDFQKRTDNVVNGNGPPFFLVSVITRQGNVNTVRYIQNLSDPGNSVMDGPQSLYTFSVSDGYIVLTKQTSNNPTPVLYPAASAYRYKISDIVNDNVYLFYFDDFNLLKNFRSAVQIGNVTVTDDDLKAIPGINFDTKSDLEKAAEMLAQQLGVDINRILDEFKLVYDENGVRYLESAKGIRTALDDLITAYNESVAGNQAIINSLEKLLEQLKAQDISGLESYISSIESTLDDLNQRDKDREGVYGDIVGTLGALKDRLGELNLDELGVISNNIADIRNQIIEFSKAQEIELDISENRLQTPSLITTKFPFSIPFDIYNLFNIFSASPKTPEFDIPLDMTSVGGEDYNIHVDLSYFDTVANIVRWLLYGVFVAGLILVTNKLIGRG